MNDKKSFKFPQALLSQINECSTGYLLITTNENGEFEVFKSEGDSPMYRLGMINFLDILAHKLQCELRARVDENEE